MRPGDEWLGNVLTSAPASQMPWARVRHFSSCVWFHLRMSARYLAVICCALSKHSHSSRSAQHHAEVVGPLSMVNGRAIIVLTCAIVNGPLIVTTDQANRINPVPHLRFRSQSTPRDLPVPSNLPSLSTRRTSRSRYRRTVVLQDWQIQHSTAYVCKGNHLFEMSGQDHPGPAAMRQIERLTLNGCELPIETAATSITAHVSR